MLSWLPEAAASFAGDIDGVMYLIYYVVGFWFLLAQGVLFYFLFRYWRQDSGDVPYVPANRWSVMAWVLIPVALVLLCDLALDFNQASVWANVKEHRPEPDDRVRITGQQFSWRFVHAGPDGKLDTEDDIQTRNRMHVPAGQNVIFHLTSDDVLHSFWVPAFRLKQDAVPGRTIQGWFKPTEPGTYEIGCAELCGVGHGVMKAELVVHNPDEYERWLKEQS